MSALAKDLLTPEQLALVRKRSDLRGTWLVFHAWAVIFGAMAVFVAFPNPLTYILAVMVIGARQLGLAILMHDGAHGILTENQKLNSFLSQWFCAYPMMAETGAYRRYHLKHHANTQQPEDPDLVLSAPFPITRKSFRRKMVREGSRGSWMSTTSPGRIVSVGVDRMTSPSMMEGDMSLPATAWVRDETQARTIASTKVRPSKNRRMRTSY